MEGRGNWAESTAQLGFAGRESGADAARVTRRTEEEQDRWDTYGCTQDWLGRNADSGNIVKKAGELGRKGKMSCFCR